MQSAKLTEIKSSQFKKKDKKEKFCNHCNQSGHTNETCFYIHGFPDRYKKLKERRSSYVATTTTFRLSNVNSTSHPSENMATTINILQKKSKGIGKDGERTRQQ